MADFNIGLGIDSFIACLAIGALPVTAWQAMRLAAAFGVCDATATLIGWLLPHAIPTFDDWVLYLICAALIGTAARNSRRFLYLVPVVLSLDNLVAGAPVSAAPGLAVSSAAMALAGLLLAGLWRRTAPGAWRWAKPDLLG
jgi:putative Mn2+ efflux pump MntP